MASKLKLDAGQMECISEIWDEILDLTMTGEVFSACDPSLTTEELLNKAIADACLLGNVDELKDVFSAFGEDDKIFVIFAAKLCPVFYCMIEEMRNGPANTEFICNIFSGFEDPNAHNLNISVADFDEIGLDPDAIASTHHNNSLNSVEIRLNIDKCQTVTPLEAFETIQHELIHADIKRRLKEDWSWNPALETSEAAFFKLVYFEYGSDATPSEHALMLKYYVDPMVESLIAYNDGVGTKNDFLGLVYNGFPLNILFYEGITSSDLHILYQDYLDFIALSGSINTSFSNCD